MWCGERCPHAGPEALFDSLGHDQRANEREQQTHASESWSLNAGHARFDFTSTGVRRPIGSERGLREWVFLSGSRCEVKALKHSRSSVG